MKKILSLVCLLMLAMTSAWADEATFNLGKDSGTSTPEGFFTHGSKWNINTKFNGAEYDGISFSKGLKMEGATQINFTTEAVSKVTIVQSTWSDKTIKLDGAELAVADAAAGTGCRIYTIENVAAGDHAITRGSGESGLFYVKVEWTSTKTVTFQAPEEWDNVYVYAWDDNENKIAGEWPGTLLSPTDERIYIWSTTEEPTKIIFNNGIDKQTADLEFKDGGMYNIDGRVITLNDYTATFKTDGMTEVWAYAWNGDDKPLGEWPGTQMTASGDGQFSIAIKAEEAPKYIIFHNNAGQQTDDLDFEDGKAYVYNLNDYTATFTTDAAWDKVYAYAWSGDTKFLGDFPGQELTATEGVYTLAFKAFKAPESILFNSGTDAGKTPDMGFTSGRKYVWNTTLNPLFKLEASDAKIPAGTTVEVKDKEDKVVATLTYGVEGGADFAAPVARPNEEVAGFTAYTAGNGENGTATSGTVYTIKPVYDGTITVGVWLNAGKAFFIQEDDTPLEGFDGIKKDYGSSTSFTFDVKANSVYKVYCTGSKLGFYGFDYTYAAPAQPETKTYYVVGNDATVFGEAWNPGFEGNKMTANQDGSYTWTSAEVNFSKEEGVQFKITDGTWDENYGLNGEANGENIFAIPTVDGANTLTITFNPTTEPKTISYEFAKEATLNHYNALFENTANWTEVYAYTYSKDEGGTVTAEQLGAWPGTKIEPQEGNYVVDIQAAAAPQFIIFHNNDGTQTEDLAFEHGKTYTYEAPAAPATDITISLDDGADIATELAKAEEGVENIGNICINLAEGDYTINRPLTAYKNFEIQGNGATIDASGLEDYFIQMAATAEVPKEAVHIEYVSIHNATIKGLKKALFCSTQKGYLINWLTIDNSVIEQAANVTTIDFTKGSAARSFNIENSTIYAPTATTNSFYSSQAGQKLTELDPEGTQTFIVKNSTMYNLATGKNFFTHRQSNQTWLAYYVENSLFVNCGKSGQTIKGMNGGQSGANPTWTITGNAFNFVADGVMTDTSADEDTGDTTEGEGVQNSVAGVVTFTDAANGDFNGEFQLADGATAPEALGDGRWTIIFKGGTEVETTYYLVGTFNNWTASDTYKLTLNENADEGVVEYMLTLDIPANSSMKVLDNIGNWYPATGPDFVVNDEGNFTVYFRPNADGDEFWFEGCIYCTYNGEPVGINTVKADDLKNAEIFNLQGQRVNKAQKGLFIVNGKKVVIK